MSTTTKNLKNNLVAMAQAAFPSEPPTGVTEAALVGAETSLGFVLPTPLRDFYSAVGTFGHVMRSHHKFVSLDELRIDDDVLVFCLENQSILWWGLGAVSIHEPDPPVLQTGGGNGAWTSKYKQVSVFLIHMTCWQLINALPSSGRCEVDFKAIKAFREEMTVLSPAFGYGMNSIVDFDRGIFVTVLSDTNEIYIGARDDRSLEEFALRKGVDLDWL